MKRLAILASHNGSGMDAIYEAIQNNILACEIVLVISNNSDSHAIRKAASYGTDTFIVNSKNADDPDSRIEELLHQYDCDLIFLSGYMKKLAASLTQNFTIINSHPSLLPKFGGAGMYGRYVHEAVIAAGEKESGVTIHFVDENFDEGEIIYQASLKINANETAESLEERIKRLEKVAIVEGMKLCLK